MGRRADRGRRIEPAVGGGGEERRHRSLRVSRLVASMDEAARRHPATIAAALFCGGVVTGTWLGRVRSRGGRGERQDPGDAGGEPPGPREETASSSSSGPAVTVPATRPPAVTRRRDPIGSPSMLQH